MAWAKSRAAEGPLAASLVALCPAEPWCGWTRKATAAIAMEIRPAMTQPRAPLMPPPRPVAGTAQRPASRAHRLARRLHDRHRPQPRKAGGEVRGAQGPVSYTHLTLPTN